MRVLSIVFAVVLACGALWVLMLRSPAGGHGEGAPLAGHAPPPRSPLAEQAQALIDDGRADAARELLDAQADPEHAALDAVLLRIDLLRLTGEAERAMQLAERAAQRWPDRSELHHVWAKAIGTRMREGGMLAALRWIGAYKQQMAEAVALDPGNVAASVDEIGFLVYAPALVGGDRERAKQLGESLRAIDDASGSMMTALAYDQSGDKATAITLCTQALERNPGHQDLGFVLTSLLDETGRQQESLAAAERVLAGPRTPAYYRALYHRARLGLDRGRDAAACLADLDDFVARAPPADFMPTRAQARYHRGRALEGLGRPDEARASYAAALADDPELQLASLALQRLR